MLYENPDLYDALLPVSQNQLDFYITLAERHPGAVLELACGSGQLIVPIAAKSAPAVGLDRSPEMLAVARRRAHAAGVRGPWFLPDGKHFVYLRIGLPDVTGIYVGSLDAKPAEQSKERILATATAAPYIAGNLFFLRDGTLMMQPFDDGKLQLRGEPVPIAEHVGAELSNGYFSLSPPRTFLRTVPAQH